MKPVFVERNGFLIKKQYNDLISGIFFLAFSVVIYIASFSIKVNNAEALGPQFFPRIVAYCMGILSILLIIQKVRAIRGSKKTEEIESSRESIKNIPFLLTSLLLVLYMFLIKPLGFIMVSIFYLFFQITIIIAPKDRKKKNMTIIILISIVIPILLYLLFYHVFNIFLPQGILG